ncbi:hypothetical protein SEA_ARCADIA_93 [Arthrobacter phage Arcadia]|uniref:Uncharacterized protein n=3 Tax=Mudcatvirus TaxID=1982088 RepID=A0A222Z8X0_9CAUD|nr:hypothetical protein PQB74_gp93 [Arthrobacter phage Arcadia]YP_010666183.1 hypothetical protein PQB75_gp098 [Arthrobacter phage Tribby]YP_010666284.1 hypothetical protein PQB76_gp097 [Arthrobacter phage Cheesy]ASR80248.1 hypothetical protein SEA_ELSA_93 [Arthrobacter phage Elsa]ASR80445.1 hypothetical protein SEA_NASON_93 [Arthrobacter phage Nason]UYL87357.1 hypothetical protein SEA_BENITOANTONIO_94 [Arthrobacter phage BenitoAntonio]ASR80055.1 hypothetical protein SEA_ARCADIA_93 [Arthrobac
MSDPEYAKVTITVETSDSVETVVIPKARDIHFEETAWLSRGYIDTSIRLQPSNIMSLDMNLVAEYDEETDSIMSKERKPIKN